MTNVKIKVNAKDLSIEDAENLDEQFGAVRTATGRGAVGAGEKIGDLKIPRTSIPVPGAGKAASLLMNVGGKLLRVSSRTPNSRNIINFLKDRSGLAIVRKQIAAKLDDAVKAAQDTGKVQTFDLAVPIVDRAGDKVTLSLTAYIDDTGVAAFAGKGKNIPDEVAKIQKSMTDEGIGFLSGVRNAGKVVEDVDDTIKGINSILNKEGKVKLFDNKEDAEKWLDISLGNEKGLPNRALIDSDGASIGYKRLKNPNNPREGFETIIFHTDGKGKLVPAGAKKYAIHLTDVEKKLGELKKVLARAGEMSGDRINPGLVSIFLTEISKYFQAARWYVPAGSGVGRKFMTSGANILDAGNSIMKLFLVPGTLAAIPLRTILAKISSAYPSTKVGAVARGGYQAVSIGQTAVTTATAVLLVTALISFWNSLNTYISEYFNILAEVKNPLEAQKILYTKYPNVAKMFGDEFPLKDEKSASQWDRAARRFSEVGDMLGEGEYNKSVGEFLRLIKEVGNLPKDAMKGFSFESIRKAAMETQTKEARDTAAKIEATAAALKGARKVGSEIAADVKDAEARIAAQLKDLGSKSQSAVGPRELVGVYVTAMLKVRTAMDEIDDPELKKELKKELSKKGGIYHKIKKQFKPYLDSEFTGYGNREQSLKAFKNSGFKISKKGNLKFVNRAKVALKEPPGQRGRFPSGPPPSAGAITIASSYGEFLELINDSETMKSLDQETAKEIKDLYSKLDDHRDTIDGGIPGHSSLKYKKRRESMAAAAKRFRDNLANEKNANADLVNDVKAKLSNLDNLSTDDIAQLNRDINDLMRKNTKQEEATGTSGGSGLGVTKENKSLDREYLVRVNPAKLLAELLKGE
jgi:hypothetical protein